MHISSLLPLIRITAAWLAAAEGSFLNALLVRSLS
jgi:hypothetical protein